MFTTANLDHVTRQSVDPVVTKIFGESLKVLSRIPMHTGDPINTRGLEVNVYDSPNPSWGNHPEAGGLAVPGQEETQPSRVYPVRFSRGDEVSGTARRVFEGQADRILIGNLAAMLSRSAETAAKIIEQNVCATETGELAVVVSRDSATQITVAKTYAQGSTFSTKKLRRRQRIAYYSAAGVQRTGTNSLSIISNTTEPNPNTGVVTVDLVPTDVVATDIIVYGDPITAGSHKKALTGLQNLVSSTGVIQGVDRALKRGFQAYEEDAGGANIGVARLVRVRNNLRNRVEDDLADLEMLTSPTQVESFLSTGYNFINRQGPGGNFAQDYNGMQFGGKSPIESFDIHEDRFYFLRFSTLRKAWIKEFGKLNDDGMDWRLEQSGATANDAWVCWWLGEGAIFAKQFNDKAVIKNLATANYSSFAAAN